MSLRGVATMDETGKVERKRGPKGKDETCNIAILNRNNTYWSGFKEHMISEFEQDQGDWESQSVTKVKYLAALCLLTKVNLRDISSFVGASYGTIRNWSSQDYFKELVDAIAEEFAGYIIDQLEQEYDDLVENTDNIVISHAEAHNVYVHNDIDCYSEFVFKHIYQNIRTIYSDMEYLEENYHFHGYLLSIFDDILYTYDDLRGSIQDIKRIVDSDEPISGSERSLIIQLLNILEGKLQKHDLADQ
ncbi:hypothetical protein ACFLZI_03965 [Nitrospirota bacterium]